MKKRILPCLLIVTLLLLSISLWKNHSYASEKEQLEAEMLSKSYQALHSISSHMDELLSGLDEETMTYEQCETKGFIELLPEG